MHSAYAYGAHLLLGAADDEVGGEAEAPQLLDAVLRPVQGEARTCE